MRFNSDISIWWLLPWIGVSILLSIYLYKKENWFDELHVKWKLILKILRASSIFLLGVLIIGLLFESVTYRIEKPIFISLIDNSSSLTNYKDSNDVKNQINSFQKKLNEKYKDRFELKQYTIGSKVLENGKISLTENISDLANGFEHIHSTYYNRNIGGIAFISDGNFNKGSNPIYSAEKIDLTPIFTLGVGDSTPQKDQYIKNVNTNEIAFLKNKFPIEIDVEAIKMGKTSATVSIQHAGKTVASQNISFTNGKYDYKHISFLIEANQLGFQQYTVSVSKSKDEHTLLNNTRNFYIEILDSRSKIIVLAGAPHPDVAAIKSVIEKDENLDVNSYLIKDWKKDTKNVDLIIWHEPGIQFDNSVLELINNLNIPILYCLGPNTPNSIIQKLNINTSIPNGTQIDEVQAKFNSNFEKFEISPNLQNVINFYPPLTVKFGHIKTAPNSEILLYQKIGNIQKDEPILYFGSKDKVKYGVILGEGIWKWKLNEYVRFGETINFTELFQKITQYLVVKQNNSSLRVNLPKRFYVDEEVEIKAEFYNDAMQLIIKPKIDFKLKHENGHYDKFQFSTTDEYYKLNLGTLKPGKYDWVASTKFDGKTHHKSGTFIVENIVIEQLESSSNFNLLNQISNQSHGNFHLLKDNNSLLNEIDQRKDIAEMSYKESIFKNLIDIKWLFFLLITLCSLEWFLRRFFGAY
ncbi:MAG: hypothetical protein HYR91_03190 [Flavobacteriia bacterium]|nr:hypothetical protein [Flavobacteriia bacterium]